MRAVTIPLVALLLQCVQPPSRAADATASDLEGVWVLVTDPGTPKEKTIPDMVYVFKNDRFVLHDLKPGGKAMRVFASYHVEFDPKKKPAEVNVYKTDRKTKKLIVQKGIYRLKKGGFADWCVGKWGGDRPIEFKDDPAKEIDLFHLKKVAKSAKEYDEARKAATGIEKR